MDEIIKLLGQWRKSHTSHRQDWGLQKQHKENIRKQNKIYSQWFPGWMNDVSYALSWDDDRSDNDLINIFRSFTLSQIPYNFKIVPLPIEVSSWLILMLQRLTVKENLRERYTQTKLGCGQCGKTTADQLELFRIISSTTLPEVNKLESWDLLPWLPWREIFRTISWNSGWKHNRRCHFICLTELQVKWPAKPNKRWRRQT